MCVCVCACVVSESGVYSIRSLGHPNDHRDAQCFDRKLVKNFFNTTGRI